MTRKDGLLPERAVRVKPTPTWNAYSIQGQARPLYNISFRESNKYWRRCKVNNLEETELAIEEVWSLQLGSWVQNWVQLTARLFNEGRSCRSDRWRIWGSEELKNKCIYPVVFTELWHTEELYACAVLSPYVPLSTLFFSLFMFFALTTVASRVVFSAICRILLWLCDPIQINNFFPSYSSSLMLYISL